MLSITVPEREIFDEKTGEFIYTKETTLQLEHSLVSLSKWESKWHVPFIHTPNLSIEQTLDYFRCMTITKNVDPLVYQCLTADNINRIKAYIDDPMTATTITERNAGPRNREILTSEVLYYQMIALGIPFECQKWHLNRLIMLIRVCAAKNQTPKKMGKTELANRNRALNAARKKRLNTKG